MPGAPRRIQQITIANGQSLSDILELGEAEDVVIIMPAAWTAAAITFSAEGPGATATSAGVESPVAGTQSPVFDEGGTELTIASAAAVASRAIVLSSLALQAMTAALDRVRLRSGTSAVPVAQGAARTFTVYVR